MLRRGGGPRPRAGDAAVAGTRVYADVPPKLHAMALRSLTAHLLKLEAEGDVPLPTGRRGLGSHGDPVTWR